MSPLEVIAISTGVAAFVATNLDDILILTILFSQTGKLFRHRDIVIGQYIGFSLLVIASLAGFFGCFLIPTPWIRYLGLVPVILGIVSLLKEEEKEEEPENVELDLEGAKHSPFGVAQGKPFGVAQGKPFGRWFDPRTYSVAALTVANGSDNIGIYVPLFASSTVTSLIVIVSVFLILVGVWCAIAYGLTSVPTIATILTSQGSTFVPCVLIGLGIFIVKESIPLAFLALGISYLWAIIGRSQGLARK
ncbi:MAG: cadmium resistance transporter [Microcystis sp. LE17-20A]|uniref:cadmium resistance transporter n=1 Tax=unclassified Microcystis TaxID=2643300 RepID=UPI0022C15846|nr:MULTISPECIES: cadmium resistance transporter [unclassified Microcystis]MCZ8039860.1 cadmium resistance transporter [Microcystis sp. LE17-20A]MCZ8214524.1 cadmium resistance transporter [Microcystis sp. LE19-8.1F]